MLEQEAINRMRKRNDLIEVKEYNKGLDQELSHRMK